MPHCITCVEHTCVLHVIHYMCIHVVNLESMCLKVFYTCITGDTPTTPHVLVSEVV